MLVLTGAIRSQAAVPLTSIPYFLLCTNTLLNHLAQDRKPATCQVSSLLHFYPSERNKKTNRKVLICLPFLNASSRGFFFFQSYICSAELLAKTVHFLHFTLSTSNRRQQKLDQTSKPAVGSKSQRDASISRAEFKQGIKVLPENLRSSLGETLHHLQRGGLKSPQGAAGVYSQPRISRLLILPSPCLPVSPLNPGSLARLLSQKLQNNTTSFMFGWLGQAVTDRLHTRGLGPD